MARVELDIDTSVPPERVRQALIDFSERRPSIWPGIEPSLYEVYSVGATSAFVKEGSKMPGLTLWALEDYDWSDPRTVRWTARESNFCASGSYVAATLNPRPEGGTRIHVEWDRTAATLAGRLIVAVMVLTRGGPIRASLKPVLKRLEQEKAPS